MDSATSSQEQQLWQTFFAKLLLVPKDDSALTSLFKSLSAPHLQKFAAAMAGYLKEDFDASLVSTASRNALSQRSKLAQQYLRNMKRGF